ncbi:beta-lactamase-like protein [Diaporthe sp. PMI_573]|nr:beta-lactamase-like protein [Diaporthaceae sp. PMI_573]
MSTFDGIIKEFPGVRVDFFRNVVDDPPLACFLSHIHSDHIAGLDTFKGRLVYCSAATRAILLKLQRKASRINFAQGVLEVEEITYKHQKNRLKALPLNTPTDVELTPNSTVRVTLFDANHCPGAVMFLFEGDGKAVLYTGDIRCEPWHIDALLRNPCMFEYAIGRDSKQLKTLDKVYLDTSFTEDVQFQTKSEGLRELLEKVAQYPEDTLVYFSSWTYGYEDVWIALAKALGTQIHVDDYKMKVYESLRVKNDNDYIHLSPEAPALVGFSCGNRFHPGCLTRDPNVRLHSCEKGSGCLIMQNTATSKVVWITPIVAHLRNDDDMVEVGIGGGAGDLEESDQVVLATEDLRQWLESVKVDKDTPKGAKLLLHNFLKSAISAKHHLVLNLVKGTDPDEDSDLHTVYRSLVAAAEENRGHRSSATLSNRIRFPYSRHSSYGELCQFVSAFKPKDVWPCTVDTMRWIRQGITIEGLFGNHCSGNVFDHDKHMAQLASELHIADVDQHETQISAESGIQSTPVLGMSSPLPRVSSPSPDYNHEKIHHHDESAAPRQATTASVPHEDHGNRNEPGANYCTIQPPQVIDLTHEASESSQNTPKQDIRSQALKRSFESFADVSEPVKRTRSRDETAEEDNTHLFDSQETSISAGALETRRTAFNSVLHESNPDRWAGLLCTTNNHAHEESELGEERGSSDMHGAVSKDPVP